MVGDGRGVVSLLLPSPTVSYNPYRLSQRHDESYGDLLRRLRRHAVRTVRAQHALHPLRFRFGDPGDVPEGDLERTPVDYPKAGRPAEQPVMRVDAGESLRQLTLNVVDATRGHDLALSFSSTASALRRIPSAPGRSNAVSP